MKTFVFFLQMTAEKSLPHVSVFKSILVKKAVVAG